MEFNNQTYSNKIDPKSLSKSIKPKLLGKSLRYFSFFHQEHDYNPVDTRCRFNVYKTSIRRRRRRIEERSYRRWNDIVCLLGTGTINKMWPAWNIAFQMTQKSIMKIIGKLNKMSPASNIFSLKAWKRNMTVAGNWLKI